jgi:hypothetical protein
VFELLADVAAFVRKFYEEFRHRVTGYLARALPKSNIGISPQLSFAKL